jgi:hypothetical protein
MIRLCQIIKCEIGLPHLPISVTIITIAVHCFLVKPQNFFILYFYVLILNREQKDNRAPTFFTHDKRCITAFRLLAA